MRLTIHVLGAELLSVEFSASDPPDYLDEDEDEPSGATGGQYELGFTLPPGSTA